MCIIIAKKASVPYGKISASIIEAGYSNKDGGGFALKRKGESIILLDKGYFDYEAMVKKIEKLKIQDDDELIVHLRIGTSGEVNNLNCHPFVVSNKKEELCIINDKVNKPVLAHNGILYKFVSHEDEWDKFSDTFHFVRRFFSRPWVSDMIHDEPEECKFLIGDHFGYSKYAVMYPDKKMLLINEKDFIEDEGVLYSTRAYMSYRSTSCNYGWKNKKKDYNWDNNEYWDEMTGQWHKPKQQMSKKEWKKFIRNKSPEVTPLLPITTKTDPIKIDWTMSGINADNYKNVILFPLDNNQFDLDTSCTYCVESWTEYSLKLRRFNSNEFKFFDHDEIEGNFRVVGGFKKPETKVGKLVVMGPTTPTNVELND